MRKEYDGVCTYLDDLALAIRYKRLAMILSQIAPGERTRFFSTPQLVDGYRRASYTVVGVSAGIFDLGVQDPSSFEQPARVARITLAEGSGELQLPSPEQVELDIALIRAFEDGLVQQPDQSKDPDAKLILHPRVTQLPPTIRFYHAGRATNFREHSFDLSGERYTVLVPNNKPDTLPLASYEAMLKTLRQIEALYIRDTENLEDINDLQNLYPEIHFIDTAGDWSIVPSDRSVLHVGGGS